MRNKPLNTLLTGLLLTPIPMVARSETYLTEDQAANILFPGVHLQARDVVLTLLELKDLSRLSGTKPLAAHVRVLWGPQQEALFIDHVLAKHEFITYAVAIESDGRVKGIEILDYRESYGYQIRDSAWRHHFTGKSAKDPVTLDRDIPNISGATLSSKHVTDGVRRILKTYELLKAKA